VTSWKATFHAPREAIQTALLMHDAHGGWDPDIVVTGFEIAEERPEEWVLDAYLPRKPTRADRAALSGLFTGKAPPMEVERLEEADWVSLSQQGVDPIRAGRFHVRTPDHDPASGEGIVDFVIPASQAFGTGQHETTAGCLAMLDLMRRTARRPRAIADIGTGTGLLAFAALRLWPRARIAASDIDPVCLPVIHDNAKANGIVTGRHGGQVWPLIADGMDDARLKARAPFDLLIANILAGPLIELSADFDAAIRPGGDLLLAGLLETQERGVRAAYRKRGFRLIRRHVRGDWSILWLRKRITG
jgi:ribosomal protein L11 methyltransferase